MTQTARVDFPKLAPKAYQNLRQLSTGLRRDLLSPRLIELVFLRVSQINGCAFCMDMHWRDLMKLEMDPRHANAVAGWREAPFFDERERAALEWAEIVTAIPASHPGDEAFARLHARFSDEEIAELAFVISTINAWNLICVSLRNPIPAKA
ncbi:carboxymuconolactone decarboxylase family protein [Trinickia caryophylli]|uniref:Alkylhydroperoxidase AhpD family core domain-containing protein n=1 Tax=Trinickia caryophylli TaxID=28094 RepID=A0A1X7CVD9_TRICW|nr:carboxymuconolactone decarboxylase family protein [Trinickia caryophylli]PMS13603.1 carboxymuconolactone decarboxylase family protein [Trinickia caryophylli]TRX13732.1 carboxymuconolactone decarboxylase family protein [Trinickia caryophylli]WQE15323.1 carboxymuconolactone decarboxylase family protein [Trinickia caryophylli]SMF03785.1 alkylhydroperoxidase AhpD family core domain-containing protein [Trinickia caryophylli]